MLEKQKSMFLGEFQCNPYFVCSSWSYRMHISASIAPVFSVRQCCPKVKAIWWSSDVTSMDTVSLTEALLVLV